MGVDSRTRHLVEALHPTDRAHLSVASSVTRWMIAPSQGMTEAASAVQPPVRRPCGGRPRFSRLPRGEQRVGQSGDEAAAPRPLAVTRVDRR